MKKWIVSILLLMLALLLGGCENTDQGSEVSYQIYYLGSSGTELVTENYTPLPDTETRKEITEEILDKMKNPSSLDHQKVLPDEVEVVNCVLRNDKQVDLDFSEAYYDMDNVREILVRAAYVKTLTQIQDIETVSITVNQLPLVDSAGNEVGIMDADTFIVGTGAGINSYNYATLTLYFASEDGTRLVKEMRNVHYSTNSTLEKVVVEQLLKGPENESLRAVLPVDARILSISMKDGLCTIDFNADFNQAPLGTRTLPEVSLYAVVNSLNDSCKVQEVQFSVEGETQVAYQNQIDLSAPFGRNDELVNQVETESQAAGNSDIGVEMLFENSVF